MPIIEIEPAGDPNSCIIKLNKQKFHALLDSGAEESLIHTRVYNTPDETPKLKKQSTFLHPVKGDSIDINGCALLKYEIGREKQESKFFVVSKMNKNIILLEVGQSILVFSNIKLN